MTTVSEPKAKPTAKLKAWKLSWVRVMPRASSSARERVVTVAEVSRMRRTWSSASGGSAGPSTRPVAASIRRMLARR